MSTRQQHLLVGCLSIATSSTEMATFFDAFLFSRLLLVLWNNGACIRMPSDCDIPSSSYTKMGTAVEYIVRCFPVS